MTPSQLARKRANDREAQRAIRARTKEHIEKLEAEIERFKSAYAGNETVKALMAKNRKLEAELAVLREKLERSGGLPASHYPPPGEIFHPLHRPCRVRNAADTAHDNSRV